MNPTPKGGGFRAEDSVKAKGFPVHKGVRSWSEKVGKMSVKRRQRVAAKVKRMIDRLEIEAKKWDRRKNEPDIWKKLKREGWVDAPERIPHKKSNDSASEVL